MKIKILLFMIILLIPTFLFGCFLRPGTYNKVSIGEAKTFEKDGITITLSEDFKEEESKRGFNAYYVADFCGVVVLKEEFTLQEGLSDMSLEKYVGNVIRNNGYTDISPEQDGDLWFYEATSRTSYLRSYSYKGSDAFYIVQFICNPQSVEDLKDIFHLWAASVTVE